MPQIRGQGHFSSQGFGIHFGGIYKTQHMSDTIAHPFLPEQHTGEATETAAHHVSADEDTAKTDFTAACNRLKDVNHWKDLAGTFSSAFQLTDLSGSEVDGVANAGLYIRIDIPGPGSIAGQGYDWVLIEKVEQATLNEHQEICYIRARPTEHPLHKSEGVAHFLESEATSSFVITRNYDQLTATVFGRNEVPNTHTDHVIDNVRNAIIGASGALGVSKLQWGALVKGLLNRTR